MTMNDIEDWVGKGNTALAGDNLTEAKNCFERALKRDPLNAGLHNRLSQVCWRLGNLQEAMNHLTEALEWDPNDRDIISHCYEVFRALGKGKDAEEILEAYMKRNPWDEQLRGQLRNAAIPVSQGNQPFEAARFFTEQGEKQFEKGRLDLARACFEMAIEENPHDAQAHSNLGVLSWQEGDLEKALAHLHRALELEPLDFDILYNSAKALTAAGEFDTAADLLRLYLQQNPNDDAGWKDYDALLRQNGASGWRPDNLTLEVADVYIRMGEALTEAKDGLGAGQAFHRALKIDPTRLEPYYRLGCLHLELGQDHEALALFCEGLRLHPEHRESVMAAGRVFVSQNQLDEARELCETYALQHQDADAQALFQEIVQAAGQR